MVGCVGDSIIIKCRYDKKYTQEDKFFCTGYYCNNRVDTDRQGWNNEGRISVYDSKDDGYLKVIMRDLTINDEGTNWCGVNVKKSPDEHIELYLNVEKSENYFLFNT